MAKKKKEDEEDLEIGEVIEDKKGKLIIQEHDFKIESINATNLSLFDLYFLHTVNKGKPTEKVEFKVEGYGMSLKTCLNKIAAMRVADGNKLEFDSFKEFAMLYLEKAKEIEKLLSHPLINL